MNLKCIMLSESSQTQEAAYSVISFIWHFGKDKTVAGNVSVVARGWGWGVDYKGTRGKCLGDAGVLYLDCHGGYITICIC